MSKRQKKTAEEEGGEKKEHKPNWRETHASPEDIQKFLNDNILLRKNVVTDQTEFRVPMVDEFNALGIMYPTGASPLDEWRSATEWYEVNFRLDKALLTEMYCECPYPGLCKHLIAVAIILNGLIKEGLDTDKDFVAIDDSYFWGFVARSTDKITL